MPPVSRPVSFCLCLPPRAWALLWLLVIGLSAVTVVQAESSTPWRYTIGERTKVVSSPVVGPDGVIYVAGWNSSGGFVLAVLPSGSGEKWYQAFPRRIEGGLVLSQDGKTVLVPCSDGFLYALSTETGKTVHQYDTGRASAIWGSAAIGRDGTIYVASTDLATREDSRFFAFNPDTADMLWVVSINGAASSTPAIGPDGVIYFGAGSTFYAVSPDGERKWAVSMQDKILASPAIGRDGTIYIGSEGNDFYALNPDSTVRWRFAATVGAGASLGADGTVYIGTTDGFLYALNGNDGSQIKTLNGSTPRSAAWPVALNGGILTVPIVRMDGTILLGADDQKVYAFDRDGTKKWTFSAADTFSASPVIAPDGTIYFVTSGDGIPNCYLYGFAGSGVGASRFSAWPMLGRNERHLAQASDLAVGGRLVNLATRGQVALGNNMIAGVVVKGGGVKPLLFRAVGPTLKLFGVSNPLPDPKLAFQIGTPVPDAVPAEVNDNWGDEDPRLVAATAAEVGAFPLVEGSKDAAMVRYTASGLSFTAITETADGAGGVALVEIYDAATNNGETTLVNLSTRGTVGGGDNIMIGGLVVRGPGRLRLLIRGSGPALRRYGITDVLGHPSVRVVRQETREELASNTGWTSGGLKGDLVIAADLTGAFQFDETNADSALIVALDPGGYTVTLSGASGETGVGLLEVYALPD